MGKVWLDNVEVGTFSPQELGATGVVRLGTSQVGTFVFIDLIGDVNLNTTIVGTYTVPYIPVTPIGFIQIPVINPTVIQPTCIHGGV